MGHASTAIRVLLSATFVSVFCGIGCKNKDGDAPPPMPAPTEATTASGAAPPGTPPPAATPVPIQTAAPAPGQSPNTLTEAIGVSKPQMADSTGSPDQGSETLITYWLAKNYPWAQLEQQPESPAPTFVTSAATERGKRVCGSGTVQTLSKVNTTPPNRHEGTLLTKEGQVLSVGAVGDVTGIAPTRPARFCGIASGLQSMTGADGKPVQAIRTVGYFDTPANRGGNPNQFASLRACCAALQQNAASMPPPNSMYALSAAQYCHASVAAVGNPQQKDAMIAALRGYLRGAPMPAACR